MEAIVDVTNQSGAAVTNPAANAAQSAKAKAMNEANAQQVLSFDAQAAQEVQKIIAANLGAGAANQSVQ